MYQIFDIPDQISYTLYHNKKGIKARNDGNDFFYKTWTDDLECRK